LFDQVQLLPVTGGSASVIPPVRLVLGLVCSKLRLHVDRVSCNVTVYVCGHG